MTPTMPYIQDAFRRFNQRYFDNSLPEIPIRLSNAKGFLGKLTYSRKRSFWRTEQYSDFVLRINTRISLSEAELEDTIIHEMIHLYIAYHRLHDTSSHGVRFRAMMTAINRRDGRHISVTHRLSEAQRREAAGRERGRMVAVVVFEDGRTGVKVVPHRVSAMQGFEAACRRHFRIASLNWYYSRDYFFAQFPCSEAVRVYLMNSDESRTALQTALSASREIMLGGKA